MSKIRHLSTLAAPSTWPIARKSNKWVSRPMPGSHTITNALPINVVLRDILKIVSTTKEVKGLIHRNDVLVNSRTIKEERFSVGLLDIISIPKLKKNYRIVLNKQGKLNIISIPESEVNILPLKIVNKTQINKDKIQLNFSNGWNILVNKGKYKTNDVVIFDTKSGKITDQIPFEINSIVYFTCGKHISKIAKLIELKESGKLRKQKIAVVEADKEKWESSIDNLIIIGKTKPVINLTNEK